ncbi:hypothetical protein HDU91_007258 [Kappamyces sp. JEL0680]|nr:hypothetical protein HDU91_007258 [Kappamyces sp. JEL0680]
MAKKYYWLALHLLPEQGNTYNQLGVLDTYIDRPSFALDLYLRSLTVRSSFATAQSNLGPLFAKCRAKRNDTLAAGFVDLIASVLVPASVSEGRDKEYAADGNSRLELFAQQVSPIKERIFQQMDSVSPPFDLLSSFFNVLFGVCYLMTRSSIPDLEWSHQEQALVLGAPLGLLLDLSLKVLGKFTTLLANDFEVFSGTAEPWLSLVKLVVAFLVSSWSREFVIGRRKRVSPLVAEEVGKTLARTGSLVARMVGERYPGALESYRPCLEEDVAIVGCSLLDVKLEDHYDSLGAMAAGSNFDEGEIVRIRCNQILYGIRKLCTTEASSLPRSSPLLCEKMVKGQSTFNVANPAPQSPDSAAGHRGPLANAGAAASPKVFDGGSQWREQDLSPRSVARSPLAPLSNSKLNVESSPYQHSPVRTMGFQKPPLGAPPPFSAPLSHPRMLEIPQGAIVDDSADQLNTLSFLGLGSPSVHRFTLPESSVRRSGTPKKAAPAPFAADPLGSFSPLNSSGRVAGVKRVSVQPVVTDFSPSLASPFQGPASAPPGLRGSTSPHANLSRFSNPFAHTDLPTQAPRDPLFSRLSAYQQSMVSPLWEDVGRGSKPGTAGAMFSGPRLHGGWEGAADNPATAEPSQSDSSKWNNT